jgi:putative flippase GtrA
MPSESAVVVSGEVALVKSEPNQIKQDLNKGLKTGAKSILVIFDSNLENIQINPTEGVTFVASKNWFAKLVNLFLRFFFGLGPQFAPFCLAVCFSRNAAIYALNEESNGVKLLVKCALKEGSSTLFVPSRVPSLSVLLRFVWSSLFDASLLRYMAIGASGVLVNTLVLSVQVVLLGLKAYLGVPLAFESSVLWNFVLNDRFTFIQKNSSKLLRFCKYNFSSAGSFATQFLAVYFLTNYAHFHYIFASLLGIIAGFLLNYSLSLKIWIPRVAQPTPNRKSG